MQRINNRSNINFTALHIANAGDLKLYKITNPADRKYLRELPKEVDISKVMPNLTKQNTDRWHEMLEYAVDMAQEPDNITYIETLQNRPCGIITFFPRNKTIKLDCICTWPLKTGEKIFLAGKTLFYQLFKDFHELKCKKIELEAITNGPTNTIKKYTELGFKTTSRVYPTKTVMEANEHSTNTAYSKLKKLIDYTPVVSDEVNLARELY